ncbi:MAG: RNA polymerase sigma factor [Bacteroidetes bacterium]|nr:RNA polymerase sigma factor [Bacteroidota bacterium]
MRKGEAYIPDAASAARDARDQQLFARFVAGDELAFKELYAFYERPLILYCRHMLSTEQESQDVFQEVWLRVIRIRTRGEQVERFRAMLFTIARNAAINHLRNRQHAHYPVSLSQVNTDNNLALSSGGSFDEMEDLVNRALKRLPDSQREAFVLHSMLGYTFQEIADMQGVTMTGAKTRAFRARCYLRTLLSNWLGLAEDDAEEHIGSNSSHESPQI